MNDTEKILFGQTEKDAEIKRAVEYLERGRAENKRLDDMGAQVQSWIPPTPDHQGLKDFMLQQISVSRNKLDYSEASLVEAKEKSALAYYIAAVSGAARDIIYHTAENDKEVGRVNDRMEWVRKLRASI